MAEQQQNQAKLLSTQIGNYKIEKMLGKGSMGEVYLAKHPVLGHEVAIKVLGEEFSSYPELVSRFRREARAVAAMKHDAIVRAFDFGDLADGRSYYVMELLKGKSLQVYMLARGQLPIEECTAIILPLMEALTVCHKAGFIHRDIKPENIFLTTAEDKSLFPKIIDFGIAKLKHPDGEGDSVVTRIDAVLGTPLYMAPEQGPGLKADVGPWSDVYSLAATLFQMFAAKPPFYSESPMELMIMHTHRERPALSELRPDVPEALSQVIQKAMAIQPPERYQSMEEFDQAYRKALGLASDHQPGQAPGPLQKLDELDGLYGQDLEEALGGKTLVDRGPPNAVAEAAAYRTAALRGTPSVAEQQAIEEGLAAAAQEDPARRAHASAAGNLEAEGGREGGDALEAATQNERMPAQRAQNQQDAPKTKTDAEGGGMPREEQEDGPVWDSAPELVMDADISPEVEAAAAKRKKWTVVISVLLVVGALAFGGWYWLTRKKAAPLKPIRFRVVSSQTLHSCGILRSDGSVWCWGRNNFGQLGTDDKKRHARPAQVVGLKNVISIAAGGRHTCAVRGDGSVWCWGKNKNGQLGDQTTQNRLRPVQVKKVSQARSVRAGAEHTCALLDDDEVVCWGWNTFGQMGNGSDSQMEKTPVAVKGLTRIKMLAVGGFHNCVLAEDGKVWCWGKNDEGQLGVGDTQNRPTPVSIQSGGRRFSTVAAGEAHTCALTAAGKAFCWGRNASGQLGDGSTRARNRPVEVKGIDDLTLISPGGGYLGGFTCALKKNGTVWCWGNNLYGQLGGRAISNRQPRPRRVAGLKNIVSVQAGGLHTCAVAENGETRCWGRNNDGQLGLGNLDDREKPGLLKK